MLVRKLALDLHMCFIHHHFVLLNKNITTGEFSALRWTFLYGINDLYMHVYAPVYVYAVNTINPLVRQL